MQPDYFIVRYAEIGIKGKNKPFFEKMLIENIKKAIGLEYKSIKMDSSKVLIELNDSSDIEKIKASLEHVFGVANFSPAFSCETEFGKIRKTVVNIFGNICKKAKTMKIDTRRSYKNFHLTSMDLNRMLGDEILKKFPVHVEMKNPDIVIFVDVHKTKTYIYFEKIKGLGGLPVGSSGKVISLLSGGIDSPLASWMIMKRGCRVIFVHFYNEILSKPRKIEDIIKILNKYQYVSKAYFVPFSKIQNQIISKIPSRYRMILYRRFMLRIAEEIGKKEKTKGIVTGESIGQVASQTLENINSISSAVDTPIFRPLISFDKMEIVEGAEKIGTYKISIKPYQDCCSYMIGNNPATKSRIEDIEKLELTLDVKKLINEALKISEIRIIKY